MEQENLAQQCKLAGDAEINLGEKVETLNTRCCELYAMWQNAKQCLAEAEAERQEKLAERGECERKMVLLGKTLSPLQRDRDKCRILVKELDPEFDLGRL